MEKIDLSGFQEFEPKSKKFNMIISLSKSERFYFGNAFSDKYDLSSKKGVKLYYNKDKYVIAFKFIPEEEDGLITLKKLSDGSFYINAKAFLHTYDIRADIYAFKYRPKVGMDENFDLIFAINLFDSAPF